LIVVPSQVHFQYGKALLTDLFTRPVPRAVWPGKPRPPREEIIRDLFPTQYVSGGRIVNPEFSALLIFYMDFGAIGCVLGMAVYGILARWLYAYFQRNRGTIYARLLLAIGVPLIIAAVRDSPVDTFSLYAVFLGPVVVAFHVSRRAGQTAPLPDGAIAASLNGDAKAFRPTSAERGPRSLA
jgi:hypothetical protein